MQGQNLLEVNSGVEEASKSCSKALSTEEFSVSLSENSGRTGINCLNQNISLDATLEVEMVHKKLHGKSGDGRLEEGSLENSQDATIMESSNTWGDFEGFNEFKLMNLNNIPESLEKTDKKETYANDMDANNTHPITSCRQFFSKAAGYNEKETFSDIPVKVVVSSDDTVKLSFPEVPVSQCLDKISTLEQVLNTKREDTDIPECTKKQVCIDSANLWKTLTTCNKLSGLRCHWSQSHCQENLLATLGIDAYQKAVPEVKDKVLEKTNRENEDSRIDKFNIATCKALIQTKLSVSPEPRQNHLFSYNLFLKKTPSGGNMQYITVPQKKRIFTTQSLRMKMFSSNVC